MKNHDASRFEFLTLCGAKLIDALVGIITVGSINVGLSLRAGDWLMERKFNRMVN